MKKIMFNDRHHLTEAVLAKYKRQTRRIESRQRYQVGEVVACINTKRDFIGIELTGEYFRIADKQSRLF